MYLLHKTKGFTLIEAVMATGIFAIFVIGIFASLQFTLSLVHQSKVRIVANGILNEQMELVKNVAYENVGIVNGIPNGVFERTTIIEREGLVFQITRTIRYVDDPYDGLVIDENDYDAYPGDYKFVQIEAVCTSCGQSKSILITAHIGPKVIETDPENGAVAIRVVDSMGNPIRDATVQMLREGPNFEGGVSLQGILTSPSRMDISGNFAYVLDAISGEGVLKVFNVSNPENIVVVATLTSSRLAHGHNIKIVGNYAYITASGRFEVVDISIPSSPILLGTGLPSASFVGNRDLDVVGSFAYIASALSNTLSIINISNPSQPQLTLAYQDNNRLAGISAVKIVDNRAFVVTEHGRFEVLDVSNAWWIQFVGGGITSILSDSTSRMEILGDRAYVTSYSASSLQVFNISNPASVTVEGNVQDTNLLAGIIALDVKENEVYVANHVDNSIRKINVSDPLNPIIENGIKDNILLDGARSLHVVGNYAYVLMHKSGSDNRALRIVDLSSINVVDTTDKDGYLYVYNVPPSSFSLKVWKEGYTESFTIEPSEENPNPINLPLSISSQSISTYTMIIDPEVTISVDTVNLACEPISSVTFPIKGTRLIGQEPDVFMVDTVYTTDMSGHKNILNTYWDTYWLEPRVMFMSNHTYAGMIPIPPISISAGSQKRVMMVVEPYSARSLWVLLTRQGGIPQGGVTTTLAGPNGYLESRKTGDGLQEWYFSWESPQFTPDMAFMSENVLMIAGMMFLAQSDTIMSGYGESAMYDFGDEARYHTLSFDRNDAPSSTVRVQIATSNNPDESVWKFIGPDGTDRTYFEGGLTDIWKGHHGQRYFKFRVFFDRTDSTVSPGIYTLFMLRTQACIPPGQVYFGNLAPGMYTLTVERYNDFYSFAEYQETFNIDEKNYIRHELIND